MLGLPIRIVTNDFQHIIEAAEIKAKYPLSFANCFTVATALREKATIMTGDTEFTKIEGLVEIEWIM